MGHIKNFNISVEQIEVYINASDTFPDYMIGALENSTVEDKYKYVFQSYKNVYTIFNQSVANASNEVIEHIKNGKRTSIETRHMLTTAIVADDLWTPPFYHNMKFTGYPLFQTKEYDKAQSFISQLHKEYTKYILTIPVDATLMYAPEISTSITPYIRPNVYGDVIDDKITPEFSRFMDIVLIGDMYWADLVLGVIAGTNVVLAPIGLIMLHKYKTNLQDFIITYGATKKAYEDTLAYIHGALPGLTKFAKSVILTFMDFWPSFSEFHRELIRVTPELQNQKAVDAIELINKNLEKMYLVISNAPTM